MNLNNILQSEKTPLVITLLEMINEYKQEIDALKDELLKLKNETTKPKIKQNRSNLNDEKRDKRANP